MRTFLATGSLGPLSLGLEAGRVEALVGAPPDRWGGSERADLANIWCYGDVELHFSRQTRTLALIFADTFETLSGGPSLEIDPWICSSSTTLEQAMAALDEAGLAYEQRAPTPAQAEGRVLTLRSGVELGFVPESETLLTLRTLSLVDLALFE